MVVVGFLVDFLDSPVENYFVYLGCYFLCLREIGEVRGCKDCTGFDFFMSVGTQMRDYGFQKTCLFCCLVLALGSLFRFKLYVVSYLPGRNYGFRQFGFHWMFLL